MKLRPEVQEITAITARSSAQSTKEHLALGEVFLITMVGVDERIARVEEMLRTQSQLLQSRQLTQVSSAYDAPRCSRSASPLPKENRRTISTPPQESIYVRGRPYVASCRTACLSICSIALHPGILDNIPGRHFIGYFGFSAFSPKRDNSGCLGDHGNQINIYYWFQMGVRSSIVRTQLLST